MIDLINLVDNYIDNIKNTKLYLDYVNISNSNKVKYKKDLEELTELKIKFDDVIKVGKFHPDFKEVTKKYQEHRIKYYSKEDIVLEKELSNKLLKELNNFIKEITNSISKHIPVSNELGFVEKVTGGSSCGSN